MYIIIDTMRIENIVKEVGIDTYCYALDLKKAEVEAVLKGDLSVPMYVYCKIAKSLSLNLSDFIILCDMEYN